MKNTNDPQKQPLSLAPVIRRARISECGKYRFALTREWDNSKPSVMFLMLNPSTADADIDDPTIRRCMAFAKAWGYGSIYVGNLFPFRATDPQELLKEYYIRPHDHRNNQWLSAMASSCSEIICAWGNWPILERLYSKKQIEIYEPLHLKGFFEKLRYLELSKDNTPKHPLYLRGSLTPKEFEPTAFRFFSPFL